MDKSREQERRKKLMQMREERLPDIKKQFEEGQNRRFNSNFKAGGKDEQYGRAKRGRKAAGGANNGHRERNRGENVVKNTTNSEKGR